MSQDTAEDSEIQGCIDCLHCFVRVGGQKINEWLPTSQESNSDMICMKIVELLVHQAKSHFACIGIGPMVSTMLLRMPQQVLPRIAIIMEALINRMYRCDVPLVSTKLIAAIIRLAVMNAKELVNILPSILCTTETDQSSGLKIAMQCWTKFHCEVQGEYMIKLSTFGLIRILSTMDVRLQEISVTGREIFKNPDVITTRSRSRQSAPNEWTTVPLPIKIVSLLLDQYQELSSLNGKEGHNDVAKWCTSGVRNEDSDICNGEGSGDYTECDADDNDYDDDDEDDYEFEEYDDEGDEYDDGDFGWDGGKAPLDDLDGKIDPLASLRLHDELDKFLGDLLQSNIGIQLVTSFSSEFTPQQHAVMQSFVKKV